MPSTDQGLGQVMPGKRAESNKGNEAKSEAKGCEGRGSEAVEEGRDCMVIMKIHSNYHSSRHT